MEKTIEDLMNITLKIMLVLSAIFVMIGMAGEMITLIKVNQRNPMFRNLAFGGGIMLIGSYSLLNYNTIELYFKSLPPYASSSIVIAGMFLLGYFGTLILFKNRG